MSTTLDPASLPAELRELGAFRRLYETSGSSVFATVRNGLFPMPFAIGLIVAAQIWLAPPDWKYYLLIALGGVMFLNGLRVVIQALRRRRQKIATFEDGLAIWRNDALKVFRWDQVEEVDTSPQFFGFTIICHNDEGRREKIHFDTSTDPTMDHRGLCREAEELSAKAKLPAVLKTIAAGEEAEFVRRVWGKIVGTRIGLSRMGISQKPRYGSTQFVPWSEVEHVMIDGEVLRVTEKSDSRTWCSQKLLDLPGYAAIVAAAEPTKRAFMEQVEQVEKERAPNAFAAIEAGQEVTFGNIGVSLRGLRVSSENHTWLTIFEVDRHFDHIAIDADPEGFRLEYGPLSLADRIVLYSAVVHARDKANSEGSEDDFDDDDEEKEG